ncbi:YciI family protein [Gilliamella sp. ESL0405]|uniref:YciI family protein n=1 Tax=Gilliamella sp. ESL0405 TaxID=2704653 RepID=UPI001C6956A6|nr:YciI family protein [Gilliamella sp. ESL0405]QYN46415.1 GTP cyclohydrolase [Gilliamella sp. ESL0405]
MFIFTLTYIKPINEVEKFLQQHIDYLEENYRLGHFIASGRKVPRTGGVILCPAENKEQALTIMQKDPFYIQQIAQYDIIEFVPSKYTTGFEQFI